MTFDEAIEAIKAEDEESRKIIEEAEKMAEEMAKQSEAIEVVE